MVEKTSACKEKKTGKIYISEMTKIDNVESSDVQIKQLKPPL